MKRLILLFSVFAFISTAAVNSSYASESSTVVICDKDHKCDDKCKKDCKKKSAKACSSAQAAKCSASQAKASKCSKGQAKSCCAKGGSKSAQKAPAKGATVN